MKNLIKHSKKGILIVITCATMLSFANNTPFNTIKNIETSSLISGKEKSILTIKDADGAILYKVNIRSTGEYYEGFDLKLLPNAAYTYETENKLQISIIPFTVNDGVVEFKKENENIIHKPQTRVDGNRICITQLALKGEPLEINIYSTTRDSETLLFSETIKDTKTIEKTYNLQKGKRESYRIVYHTEGRTFIQDL